MRKLPRIVFCTSSESFYDPRKKKNHRASIAIGMSVTYEKRFPTMIRDVVDRLLANVFKYDKKKKYFMRKFSITSWESWEELRVSNPFYLQWKLYVSPKEQKGLVKVCFWFVKLFASHVVLSTRWTSLGYLICMNVMWKLCKSNI